MSWSVEHHLYSDSNGRCIEEWCVVEGRTRFRCDSAANADWLAAQLNSRHQSLPRWTARWPFLPGELEHPAGTRDSDCAFAVDYWFDTYSVEVPIRRNLSVAYKDVEHPLNESLLDFDGLRGSKGETPIIWRDVYINAGGWFAGFVPEGACESGI